MAKLWRRVFAACSLAQARNAKFFPPSKLACDADWLSGCIQGSFLAPCRNLLGELGLRLRPIGCWTRRNRELFGAAKLGEIGTCSVSQEPSMLYCRY
jgi:hypothetical protein